MLHIIGARYVSHYMISYRTEEYCRIANMKINREVTDGSYLQYPASQRKLL